MSWARSVFINGTLLAGSLLIAFGSFEIGLRVVAVLSDPPRPGHHEKCCVHDPLLGWKHKPDTVIETVGPGYRITESYNSRGVRGPEYPLDKAPGETRILIIGDSFAEGITVDFEFLFSEVAKRRLLANGHVGIEVINLGVAGYSTDQQLLQFRTEGKRYLPDITVLLVYDNDIWFNAQSRYTMMGRGYKPLFVLSDGSLELTTGAVPWEGSNSGADPVAAGSGRPVSTATLGALKQALNEYSHTYRWVRERVRNTARVQSFLVSVGLMNPDSTTGIPPAYEIYRRSYLPQTRHAWDMTRALIAEIAREAESVGSQFVLAHAPFSAAIHEEDWTTFKLNYGVTDAEWNPHRVNTEMTEIATDLSIDFLNPVNAMQEGADRKRLYFEHDPHWNSEGNRFFGELLARHLNDLIIKAVRASPP